MQNFIKRNLAPEAEENVLNWVVTGTPPANLNQFAEGLQAKTGNVVYDLAAEAFKL